MILDRIVATKMEEVALLKKKGIHPPPIDTPPSRGFQKALAAYEGMAIIAEAKKASPSKGIIRNKFDPVAIARQYEAAGAQAMSVLTDRNYFQGDIQYLADVRAAVSLPVLRKDFIIHELQIEEAKAYGADAILLIAAILDDVQLLDYRQLAEENGMDVLVEVHDEVELERSVQRGACLVGINNRNLRDFSVSLDTTFRLKRLLPPQIPVVSESGIRDHEDMIRLSQAGVNAVLVGETFMRAEDPGDALSLLRNGNRNRPKG